MLLQCNEYTCATHQIQKKRKHYANNNEKNNAGCHNRESSKFYKMTQ